MADNSVIDAEDVIRIMVATDSHLGYAEKDPERGEDSFTAFQEMLELAVSEDVDLILLGGDLFHDAVPSQNSLHKCIQLLRRYTFGDKPVNFEVLSDQSRSFHNAVNQSVNYEDPNLNISIPVFSIHGNHDDPSGFGRLSSLDLLSTSGLVNYFGRCTNLADVQIDPILLRKGETKLALYGLSHIHDARLARLFEDYKVTINGPTESEDWFHLMVLHQNRADRGPKNFLPEAVLPKFLHLVIWGHEHDCRIEPELNVKQDFYVSQPGSSVPTSLAEGESLKKHVGLLEIYKTKFQMKPLPLETVRPFIFESVNLADVAEELHLDDGDASEKVRDFAQERVEAMIERAKDLLTGHPKQPKVPLIRLRLLFTNESHMFNTIRFGQLFSKRIANPADVVNFKKILKKTKRENIDLDKDALRAAMEKMEVDSSTRVEELLDRYFEEVKEKNPLKLIQSKSLAEMTFRLVERSDNNAADNIIKFYKEKAIERLMETLPSNETEADEQMQEFRQSVSHDVVLKMLDEGGIKIETNNVTGRKKTTANSREVVQTDMNDSSLDTTNATASGRGRGRGRGAAAGTRTTAASKRGAATSNRAAGNRSTAHAMPALDVSISSKGTLLNAVGNIQAARKKKLQVYTISDDSD